MTAHPPVFLTLNDIEIAVRYREGAEPGIVWLGGYRAGMPGGNAGRVG